MIGLSEDPQRQSFVNQLQMALCRMDQTQSCGDRPPARLLVMDEAQTLAPARGFTACTRSTLACRRSPKVRPGTDLATQAPRPAQPDSRNAITQFLWCASFARADRRRQEMARAKGGLYGHQQAAGRQLLCRD